MFVWLAMPEDVDAIVGMAGANCAETLPHHEFDETKVRAVFFKYLTEANPTFYMVGEHREPFGFLQTVLSRYDFTNGHFLVQKVLYVRPDKRGTRAAALLMEHLLFEASRLEVKEIVGGNDNGFHSERTARFLEHYGFERSGFSMRRVYGRQER